MLRSLLEQYYRLETHKWTAWCTSVVVSLLTLFAFSIAVAQDSDSESDRVYELETIIVTAERMKNPLSASTAATSVLTAEEIRDFPISNISDALGLLPGISFFNRDGLGRDPLATVRGFYGGGEAEYLLVLMDGKQLNNIETGVVNWNSVPLSSIESIEVIRGGASSLYGDTAIGGVVNILTKDEDVQRTRLSSHVGRFGVFSAQLRSTGRLRERGYSLFASEERNDGFRDHADREIENVGGSISLLDTSRASLSISTAHNWVRFDEPGPLSGAELAVSRSQSSPFYKFDHTTERKHRAGLDGEFKLNAGARLSGYISGELRKADIIRTLQLSPEFADTKNRDLSTSRLASSAQLTFDTLPTPFDSKLILGVDAALHFLSSDYYQFFLGGQSDYDDQSSADRGALDEKGDGDRRAIAGFLQYEISPTDALRLVLGARFDVLRDAFEPEAPSEGERTSTTHSAFSPKIGLNYRYINTSKRSGNLYANVSRLFKTPTLDQLFDQRSIPVEFPPFKISLSNSELEPQFGTSLEIGAYHRETILPDTLTAEVSLAAYTMDLEDELDFSLEQFRYVNIGESRHQGVEAGLKFYIQSNINLFVNYTYQSATSQIGENEGKRLKAIPRDTIAGGIRASHRSGVSGSLILKSVSGIFLDDANTITLPDYTTVDAKLSYQYGLISAAVEGLNLLDESYSTTGFPDATGSGLVYFYPAAERHLRVSLSIQM
ncbi:MAG: TonB-dependent receptor [Candidatus Poribacteria bacterium]|nr:TonB-dependent receptor [Candidatus Poribacteria bacterium]